MNHELPFDPFPFLQGPHHQTVINAIFNFLWEPSSDRKVVSLPDGDKIALEITTPSKWKPEDLTVVLVHGLCGSHQSPNLIRMVKRLEPLGIRSVRFNMRGCGSGKGLAKRIYHSGRSEDLFETIKVVKKETPDSPIVLIGFSLGGNIVLKMAGELGGVAKEFLQKMIAVSPPVDLYSSILMLGHPDNVMYERYFYKLLRADVHYRHKKFKDLPPVRLPRSLKIYEFDQIYTAPTCGFRNVHDYYSRCSSAQFIPDIAIPCKILFAEDDPIISSHSLDEISLPGNVDVLKTKKGGHMGYLGHPQSDKGFYWLDSVLVDWIREPDGNTDAL
ncbi:MAG TPA: alpha/beta fold hydrolase [Chlamydiales bacterium]|nr:alpha/beta fold hydrolase [Chlamydiales bacterium]